MPLYIYTLRKKYGISWNFKKIDHQDQFYYNTNNNSTSMAKGAKAKE